jgi:DNA-binding CsgD family transcriptional regulator
MARRIVTPPVSTLTDVRIHVESDDDSRRITSVLEALGYKVKRDLDDTSSLTQRLNQAADVIARKHKFTERERDIAKLMIAGRASPEIAKSLDISRPTVKWHQHNIFTKTGARKREGLLRLALELIGN